MTGVWMTCVDDTFSTSTVSFQNYHMVLPQASPHHLKTPWKATEIISMSYLVNNSIVEVIYFFSPGKVYRLKTQCQ